MKKGIFVFLALFLILAATTAVADDVWTMAQSEKYGTKAGGMLGRGLVNAATCFVDLIQQTVEGTQDGPPFVGTLTGLGGGLGCTALRATSGVLDVVTFWVPGFNGIPVGRSYSNCLEVDEVTASSSSNSSANNRSLAAPQQSSGAPIVVEEPTPARHDAMDYVKK